MGQGSCGKWEATSTVEGGLGVEDRGGTSSRGLSNSKATRLEDFNIRPEILVGFCVSLKNVKCDLGGYYAAQQVEEAFTVSLSLALSFSWLSLFHNKSLSVIRFNLTICVTVSIIQTQLVKDAHSWNKRKQKRQKGGEKRHIMQLNKNQ